MTVLHKGRMFVSKSGYQINLDADNEVIFFRGFVFIIDEDFPKNKSYINLDTEYAKITAKYSDEESKKLLKEMNGNAVDYSTNSKVAAFYHNAEIAGESWPPKEKE